MNRLLRMHRTFVAGSVVCGALVLTGGAHLASTQGLQTADAVLGAAIHQDDAEGNLDAAIEGYKQFLAQYGDDRPRAVQALLRMGQAYETLGRPEARDVYERVLRDYADQPEAVAAAQTRLAALEVEPTSRSAALHTELLWEAPQSGYYASVSPDGSLVAYADDLGDNGTYTAWNIKVRDLATGETRRLTHAAPDEGKAIFPIIAPDGERVVYQWTGQRPDGIQTGELRLLPLDGDRTEPRIVWSPAEGTTATANDWFPSGDRVVAVVADSSHFSIVTVSTVDGQVRQVRSIEWGQSPKVRVSPDGRYLAYSRSASREAPEKDIFLVAVDGSSESVVVQHTAHDELLGWSKGGTHVLFSSDRSGQFGLWAQRLQDAEPVGEPRMLIGNLNVGWTASVTRDGTLHYPVTVSNRRLKIAELDIETGRFLRPPVDLTDRSVGNNQNPLFSPDGETVAFGRPEGAGKTAVVVKSLKTGEERHLPHELPRVYAPTGWRPDSDHLLVRGWNDRGRETLFEVDVATGQTRPLTGLPPRGILTPDGAQILHRDPLRSPESIYSYSVADGSVRPLPGVFPGGEFSLSPDGQLIAERVCANDQSIGRCGESEIRLHPVTGGDPNVLLAADDLGHLITWTTDGTALFVPRSDPHGSGWRLWVVPVDGSDPVATEIVSSQLGRVRMHPDGKRVVYDMNVRGSRARALNQFWAASNLGLDEPGSP